MLVVGLQNDFAPLPVRPGQPQPSLPRGNRRPRPWPSRPGPGEQDPGDGAGPDIGPEEWSRSIRPRAWRGPYRFVPRPPRQKTPPRLFPAQNFFNRFSTERGVWARTSYRHPGRIRRLASTIPAKKALHALWGGKSPTNYQNPLWKILIILRRSPIWWCGFIIWEIPTERPWRKSLPAK